jgi:hypothetical protein
LTTEEILQLDAALIQAFRTIRELRQRIVAAKYLKYPPLPSIFSESLVIAVTSCLFGSEWRARFGGKDCDVLLENSDGQVRRVEVKATGEHAFQEFKNKDLQADMLVWIRFGRRFHEGRGPVEIVLLNRPGQTIRSACRMDKVRFDRLISDCKDFRTLKFGSLEELLGTGLSGNS